MLGGAQAGTQNQNGYNLSPQLAHADHMFDSQVSWLLLLMYGRFDSQVSWLLMYGRFEAVSRSVNQSWKQKRSGNKQKFISIEVYKNCNSLYFTFHEIKFIIFVE